MFGGVKGESPDVRIQDKNLYMLSVGSREHSWSVVQTTGPQPEARQQHAMHFLRNSNIMVIIGGRRLGEKSRSDMDGEFIRETHILNMHTLEWSILEFTGTPLPGIYNFSSCLSDSDDLYIFGGTEEPFN